MSDFSNASTPRITNQNALETIINSAEVNLKYLIDIKAKVELLREYLLGSLARIADPAIHAKVPEESRGSIARLMRINQGVDMTQHEIMDTLIEIEKATMG